MNLNLIIVAVTAIISILAFRNGELAEKLRFNAHLIKHDKQSWRFFSYGLIHAGWLHLMANSLWMAAFGAPVARRTGPLRFVMLMLVSAAGGALFYLTMHWGAPALLIGASGGVSGLMGASIRLIYADGASLSEGLHRDLMKVRPLTVPQTFLLPRPRAFILIWMGINVLFGMFGVGSGGRMNAIAWEAHMGGFLTGLLFFSLFDRPCEPRLENDLS